MKSMVFFAFAFTCLSAKSQQDIKGSLSITIKNEAQTAIENATVELIKNNDSSLVKIAITNSKGLADFDNVVFGEYRIRVSLVNYETKYSAPFKLSTQTVEVPSITLVTKSAKLKEVVVEAKKPFIQKLSDRIVVNVDNSIISAGSSAMDVLERSPGVSINQNDIIGLRGRQGVIIMIDGKPTPMSGTDLANYLRGLP